MNKDDREIALAWIENLRATLKFGQASDQAKAQWWSYRQLSDLTRNNPTRALAVIVEVLLATDDQEILDNLAAGPLESLLARQGEAVIDAVERLAASQPKFRELLAGVWQNKMPNRLWERVQTAAEKKG